MDISDVFGTGEVVKEAINQTGDIIKEPIGNLSNPITRTIGERFSDIVDLVFTPVELAKIYKDHKIVQFKNKLKDEINKIPESKKVAPPMNIVGPALEASKYYIDEERLRDMFAKLIASSMNSDTSSLVHPSFEKIIEQLSAFDAINLKNLKGNVSLAVDYVLGKGSMSAISNIILNKETGNDLLLISSSITNLIRLGLVTKTAIRLTGDSFARFLDDSLLRQVARLHFSEELSLEDRHRLINIKEYTLSLTSYGLLFASVCVYG